MEYYWGCGGGREGNAGDSQGYNSVQGPRAGRLLGLQQHVTRTQLALARPCVDGKIGFAVDMEIEIQFRNLLPTLVVSPKLRGWQI